MLISWKDSLADLLMRIYGRWVRMLKFNNLASCAEVALIDKEMILGRGAPEEILMHNGTSYRSEIS